MKMKMTKKPNVVAVIDSLKNKMQIFVDYIREFSQISTLHGVKYIFMRNLHFAEIFIWLIVLLASLYGASKQTGKSMFRYNENPTVITIQKNYREWNVTFPAATFCFIDNMDILKARQFIKRTWNVAPTDEDLALDHQEMTSMDDVNDEGDDSYQFDYDPFDENDGDLIYDYLDDDDRNGSNVSDGDDNARRGAGIRAGRNLFQNESVPSTTVKITATTSASTPHQNAKTSPVSNVPATFSVSTSQMPQLRVESKYRYYATFLRHLVNQTYENMAIFDKYKNDKSLHHLDMVATILQIIREYSTKSTFYSKDFKNRDFYLTPTEMGMCYVHGSKLADYITINGTANVRKDFELPTCNYMNSLCYARTEGTPHDIRYYVHSPYDIADISNKYFVVRARADRDVTLNPLETVVSSDLEKLTPRQRQCRFMFEPHVPSMRVYSFNLCRMQCRKELAFRLCRCAPYFYPREDHIPICGVQGLQCLAKHSEMLISLRTAENIAIPCHCLPQCTDVQYTIDKEVFRQCCIVERHQSHAQTNTT